MVTELISVFGSFLSEFSVGDLTFLAEAADAPVAGDGKKLSPLQQLFNGPFILIIGLLAIWYLTMLQPERRRRAEEQKLMASLKKNDRIVTIGGIHGTIVDITQDDVVTIESGKTRLKISRSAIAKAPDPNKEKKDTSDKESSSSTKDT